MTAQIWFQKAVNRSSIRQVIGRGRRAVEKRQRTGAVQDAGANAGDHASAQRLGLRAALRRFRALTRCETERTLERTGQFVSLHQFFP